MQPVIPYKGEHQKVFYIKHLRWYIVGLLMLSTTVLYLDRTTLSIAAPILRDRFNLSNTDYSHIVQAFLLAYALMQPLSGRIIDLFGTRRVFSAAVIWWSIANACHALAGGVLSFSIFRFLVGLGESANFPAAIKTVSEWFPAKERALATGIFNMGAGIGAVIAPPVVGILITFFGWRAAFIATGLIGFFWVIAWLLLYYPPQIHPHLAPDELAMIESDSDAGAHTAQPRKSFIETFLKRKDLWGLAAARFVSDPVWWFYVFWLPDYLKNARGFNIKEIAMFAWLPFLAADTGSLYGGLLSTFFIKKGCNVLTARKLALSISALCMPVALIAVRSQSAVVALTCICIAMMSHQSWAASVLTLPADIFEKRDVATAFGITACCGAIGSTIFAGIFGTVLDKIGYVPVFTAIGFMHIVAAIIIVLTVKNTVGVSSFQKIH
jgi:ACS family hexuronate transporter-like MFS transporter